jgi:hypothetical protein
MAYLGGVAIFIAGALAILSFCLAFAVWRADWAYRCGRCGRDIDAGTRKCRRCGWEQPWPIPNGYHQCNCGALMPAVRNRCVDCERRLR